MSGHFLDCTRDDGAGLGYWVQLACLLDVLAPKPGNVHRGRDFTDCSFEDFVLAAWALGGVFDASRSQTLGELVWEAVQATRRVAGGNPNLGMILLFAPLARAYVSEGSVPLRSRVKEVLQNTGVEDARRVYGAIQASGAGAMGEVEVEDVRSEPTVGLIDAMRQARRWDSVAGEYAYGYYRTFFQVLPALSTARERCGHWSPAMVEAFLEVLARVPDTLIARKEGWDQARRVSRMAGAVLDAGATRSPRGRRRLGLMEDELESRGNRLNPGTTADLTAAGLLVFFLLYGHRDFLKGPEGEGRYERCQ